VGDDMFCGPWYFMWVVIWFVGGGMLCGRPYVEWTVVCVWDKICCVGGDMLCVWCGR